MDTRTSYLGMRLEHPFIAGASPLGYHLGVGLKLELRHMNKAVATSRVEAVTIEWSPLDAI